jgi:hypothetical protein
MMDLNHKREPAEACLLIVLTILAGQPPYRGPRRLKHQETRPHRQ